MLTREEQRRADLREMQAARWARLVRLNTAEVNAQIVDAQLEQLERQRLAAEARQRRERIAAYEAKAKERERREAAKRAELARSLAELDTLLRQRRPARRLADYECRAFDANGNLYRGRGAV